MPAACIFLSFDWFISVPVSVICDWLELVDNQLKSALKVSIGILMPKTTFGVGELSRSIQYPYFCHFPQPVLS